MPQSATQPSEPRLSTRALYYASFVPLILLVLVFGVHAVMGVVGHQDFHSIIGVLGFGTLLTSVIVFLAGIHDGVVATLLLTKGKLFPALPWWVVFLYAGLWPITPRALIWFGDGPFEWVEVLIFAALAALAYWAHTARPKLTGAD